MNITNHSNHYIEMADFADFSPSQNSLSQNSYKVKKVTFNFFREIVWPKVSYTIKSIIKSATTLAEAAPNIVRVIKALGLAMIINAMLTLSKFPEQVYKFIKNISLQDIEGIILSGLDLLANPADALDSFTTFMNTLSTIEAIPLITFFSVIALPLGISLLSYKILRVSYDLVHLGILKNQVKKQVSTTDDIKDLKAYLEGKLTVTIGDLEKHTPGEFSERAELLKSRKINKLTKRTDEKIVNLMQNLLNHINDNENENDIETVNDALSDMHTLLKRKITYEAVGLGAHISYLIALVSSIALPILSPVVVPIVATARQLILLKMHDYQKGTILGIRPAGVEICKPEYERGLKLPEMIEKSIK